MKIIQILALSLSLLFLVSCSKTEKPSDKASGKTESKIGINESANRTIIDNNGNVTISLSFTGGEKYEVIVGTTEKLTQEIQGQKQTVNQKNTITYDLDVQKKPGNVFTGDMIFKRIEKSVDAGAAGKQSFDSQQKGNMKDLPPNVKILMDIIGKSYQIDFTSLGRVIATRGTEKMMKELMAGIKEKDDIKKMLEMAVRQEFGPEKLADFFEKLTNYTDSVPRKSGDKWTKEYSIESGINLTVKTIYEIAEINQQSVKVKLKSKLIDKNKNREQVSGDVVAKINVTGEQEGYILIDAATGFVNRSEVNQKIYVNETRSKKDDPKQSMTMKTTKDAHFTITANKK